MNILVLSPFLPWPLDQGGKIRIYNIIKNLAKSHAITLVALVDDRNAAEAGPLRQLCAEIILVERPARLWPDRFEFFTGRDPYNVIRYHSTDMRRELKQLLRSKTFDLVQVEFAMMWQYANLFEGIPVVLDAHNIEHHNVRQIGNSNTSPLWRALYRLEEIRLRTVEERAWRECALCFAVSDREREEIAACTGNPAKVITAPNGVDPERFAFRPRETAGRTILFLGGMDYTPNLDAARWFLNDIFPLILQQEPETKLLMVGRELWRIGDEGSGISNRESIEFHENVAEVLPWFYEADLLAVPLRQGAGTRIKVLEAFAAGLPVVATGKGSEGIAAADGEDLLIAESPQDFAAAVLRIMSELGLGKRLAANAHLLVTEQYTWEVTTMIMEEAYRNLKSI
jgi:glycosyltransferase involved in cell wall biosynthesis